MAALTADPANQPHIDMMMMSLQEMCGGGLSLRVQENRAGGGICYKLSKLIEGLFAARLLKSTASLPEAMTRSIQYLLGPKAAEVCSKALEDGSVVVPSAATLSRARLKADVLLMRLRDLVWWQFVGNIPILRHRNRIFLSTWSTC